MSNEPAALVKVFFVESFISGTPYFAIFSLLYFVFYFISIYFYLTLLFILLTLIASDIFEAILLCSLQLLGSLQLRLKRFMFRDLIFVFLILFC